MDRKINVFIGGSSESLDKAKLISDKLAGTGSFDCTVWNKDTFEYNESFLESLTKASLIHDFGLFVASADDLALIRDNIEDIPRDNVMFEYGLFLGVMGNRKTFLVQENTCKLPTDLLGYTTPRYKSEFDDEQWDELADNVAKEMLKQFQLSEIQVLPSTALAIGYFVSFLSKLSEAIAKSEGSILKESKKDHGSVLFNVLVPQDLSDNVGDMAFMYYKDNNFKSDQVGEGKRPFPIRFYKKEENEDIVLVDIPTTLNALRPSIDLLLPNNGIGEHPDKIKLERKELENFKRTLSYLVSQNDFTKNLVEVVWME